MELTTKARRLAAGVLSLALLLTGCAGPQAAAAATMHLRRTEGNVEIADGEGRDVTPAENLGLYSGYQVSTSSESYAWIDLDSVKLTKVDENSEISITREGKLLEVEVTSGSLFFNVTEPLEENETMNIRTSSLVVGIRGTCGWVTQETACLLEGTVTVTAGDQSVTIYAGERAVLTESGALSITQLSVADVPAFVLAELEQDVELAAAILEDSGLDVRNPPEAPDAAAANEAAHAAYEAVLAEYRAALADPLPYNDFEPETYDNYEIYRTNYPHVGLDFLAYYVSGGSPLFSAYYDLDGNGVDELVIGVDWGGGNMALLEIHAFDGTDAVTLGTDIHAGYEQFVSIYYSVVTADGLIIDVGNGDTTSGRVSRLRSDGYSLEQVTDSDIPSNAVGSQLDLSAHGGRINDRLAWQALSGEGAQTGGGDGSDISAYLGTYFCADTNVTLVLTRNPAGSPIIYAQADYTPDPGGASLPANAYTLVEAGANGSFQVRQASGEVIFTALVMDDWLTVRGTGENDAVDYLSGNYRRQ